jgi:hypothetical protein
MPISLWFNYRSHSNCWLRSTDNDSECCREGPWRNFRKYSQNWRGRTGTAYKRHLCPGQNWNRVSQDTVFGRLHMTSHSSACFDAYWKADMCMNTCGRGIWQDVTERNYVIIKPKLWIFCTRDGTIYDKFCSNLRLDALDISPVYRAIYIFFFLENTLHHLFNPHTR